MSKIKVDFERINEAMRRKGVNQRIVADHFEINSAYFGKVLRNGEMSKIWLEAIAGYVDCDSDWLSGNTHYDKLVQAIFTEHRAAGIERDCFLKIAKMEGFYEGDKLKPEAADAVNKYCDLLVAHDKDGQELYHYYALKA